MKINDIELFNISKYRGELMGAAMLFIILFHVSLPRNDLFFGLRRMGNIGVDIFLFLSGVGLWYAWMKNASLKHFFLRRYLRIYPAWLVVACLYYIPRFHGGDVWMWLDLVGDITLNWDFWLHDELTFWYIPATMMLYALAPFYMMLIQKHPVYRWLPVVMILWCVLVQYVTPIHQAVGHIEIFWSRMPIFFIGINMGEAIRRKETIDGAGIWMIILLFLMTLLSSIFLEQQRHGLFPLYVVPGHHFACRLAVKHGGGLAYRALRTQAKGRLLTANSRRRRNTGAPLTMEQPHKMKKYERKSLYF